MAPHRAIFCFLGARRGLNPQQLAPQASALPIELRAPYTTCYYTYKDTLVTLSLAAPSPHHSDVPENGNCGAILSSLLRVVNAVAGPAALAPHLLLDMPTLLCAPWRFGGNARHGRRNRLADDPLQMFECGLAV